MAICLGMAPKRLLRFIDSGEPCGLREPGFPLVRPQRELATPIKLTSRAKSSDSQEQPSRSCSPIDRFGLAKSQLEHSADVLKYSDAALPNIEQFGGY